MNHRVGERPLRHLLEVDDLSPGELARILDLSEVLDPPRVLRGSGRGAVVREAVGPDPHVHGDGGVPAGRASHHVA